METKAKSSSGLPPKCGFFYPSAVDDPVVYKAHYDALYLAALKLAEQNEALRKDAERYRWLRQNPQFMGWDSDYRADEIDRNVDAALAARKELK